MEEVDVRDPITLKSVPADGKTMGEVMFRGNTVKSGYLNNMKATKEALAGGWFHSGDLVVKHPDGYIELKDRSKDIIMSGGENISSIEVESTLFAHPAILEAVVVGRLDDHWGETPCAFVKLKDGYSATALQLRLSNTAVKNCHTTWLLKLLCLRTYQKLQRERHRSLFSKQSKSHGKLNQTDPQTLTGDPPHHSLLSFTDTTTSPSRHFSSQSPCRQRPTFDLSS